MLRGHGSWRPTCFIDASSIATIVIGRLDCPGALATVSASKPLTSTCFQAVVKPSATKSAATQAARAATSFAGNAELGSSTLEAIAQHGAEHILGFLLEEVRPVGFERPALVAALHEKAHLRVPSRRQRKRIGLVDIASRPVHRLGGDERVPARSPSRA